MRPSYATRLTILPRVGDTDHQLHDQLVAHAHNWFVEVAKKVATPIPHRPDESYRFRDPHDRCYGEAVHLCAGEERAWRGFISHPYDPLQAEGDVVRVRSEVQIRTGGGEAVITIRIMVGSRVDMIAPQRYNIERPRIVLALIAAYTTFCGNIEVRPGPWRVDINRVDRLVENLTQHDRFVPIVVVSRTPDKHFLVDVDSLANRLAGLAQVAALADYETAYRLSARVNKELSAYNGAVRVYWPGFSVADSRYQHPLYTVQQLASDYQGARFINHLKHTIGDIAAWRIGSDPRIWEIERAAARRDELERDAEINRLLSEVRRANSERRETDDRLAEMVEQIQRAQQEREEVSRRADEDLNEYIRNFDAEREDLEALKQENYQLTAKLQAVLLQQGIEAEDSPLRAAFRILSAPSLAEVVEAVERAANAQAVVFLPDARKSARKYRFAGNVQAAQCLLATVCVVSERYHAGELDGEASFAAAFREAGEPDFRANSSKTTLKMYRKDYERLYDDGSGQKPVLLSPHVGMGSGKSGMTLKIYWYVDQRNKRFVIGHIGEHLRISTVD